MLDDSFFEAGFTPVIDDVVIGSRVDEFRSDIRSRPLLFVMVAPRPDVVRQRDAERPEKHVFDKWGTWTRRFATRRPRSACGSTPLT